MGYHDIIVGDYFVTRDEAKAEIEAHSENFAEFLEWAGDAPEYEAEKVLYWLGY